jgi:hypothetical protein
LRILNRVREAYGQAVSSADGSFATTMFPSNARRIAAAQGDRLEFQAYGPNGERYEVTDPANLVLDAATVARGLLELDVVTAPPVKTGISVKILSPDDNAHFLTDDRVPFRGLASDPYGRVIPGNNLVWRLDNAPDSFGVGESFAKRLPAGTHTVTLEARFSGTETARVTRTVTVEALAAVEVQEFTILGEVSVPDGQTSTSPRAKPQEDLTITIRNTTRNLEASGTALAGSGRYSVGFSDPTTAVAGEGDRYFVRVSTQSGEELPVSPRNLTVVKRDLAAGEHHRDLRVHFEPPVRVPLAQQGVNMISVPFRPVTTDGSEYDSEDLANDLHVSFLVRSETDANGRMTFKVYLPGLSNPFQINGNEGYISGAAGVAGHTFQGVQWEQEQLDLALTTGVNTLAYPQGVPQGTTAEDLAQQIGAKFAIRCENGRFLFYAPGLGDPFEIEVGRGLLLGSPDGTPMTLPPGQH